MFDCCDSLVFAMMFVLFDDLIFGWYVKIFVLVQVHSHVRFGHNIVNFIAAVVVSVDLFFKLD
jgi:hypothetical protein